MPPVPRPSPRAVLRAALGVALLAAAAPAGALPPSGAGSSAGPAAVYANIPERDEHGRDQHAMFLEWNPDPVGAHEANLRALHPRLAAVVRRAAADSPDLRFVIGSGRRSGTLQRKALAWGWSRNPDSAHLAGEAVDLWPLDPRGRVTFDRIVLGRLAGAMRRAAAAEGVRIRWGGGFRGYRDGDPTHFELEPDEPPYGRQGRAAGRPHP